MQTSFNNARPKFSPDGRWVLYNSSESGRPEIFVTPFPKADGKWQVSTAGGQWARWRADGTQIYYLAPDNRLMAAEVNGKGPAFQVGVVKPLFEVNPVTNQRFMYDVSPDGQRFLVNTFGDQNASEPITVILNWTARLSQ